MDESHSPTTTPGISDSGRVEFPGAHGVMLAGRLDRAKGARRGVALFAHCFSCGKDVLAARRISEVLTDRGISVLRFDFTGLGHSGGEFANTNFSSNVQDLVKAADWLRSHNLAPDILIGHSLGGAAVIAAAGEIPEARAIATIGAPVDVSHVLHQFSEALSDIAAMGEAEVMLAGRPFRIRQQFIEDVAAQNIRAAAAELKRALLVMHAPLDQVVGIENASAIFAAAKHPKSFVSLDNSDHLLSRREDAHYAAEMIGSWAGRYALAPASSAPIPARGPDAVTVAETRVGLAFQNIVASVGHMPFLVDEPIAVGGADSGPSPFQLLNAALGACTSITLRMYAGRKGIALDRVEVSVTHRRETDSGSGEPLDIFERVISLGGTLTADEQQKLLEIANKCPVHRTLERRSEVRTRIAPDARTS
jgi:uncharacterized OsmC-like protein/alpha/beta superfamily hydrolase